MWQKHSEYGNKGRLARQAAALQEQPVEGVLAGVDHEDGLVAEVLQRASIGLELLDQRVELLQMLVQFEVPAHRLSLHEYSLDADRLAIADVVFADEVVLQELPATRLEVLVDRQPKHQQVDLAVAGFVHVPQGPLGEGLVDRAAVELVAHLSAVLVARLGERDFTSDLVRGTVAHRDVERVASPCPQNRVRGGIGRDGHGGEVHVVHGPVDRVAGLDQSEADIDGAYRALGSGHLCSFVTRCGSEFCIPAVRRRRTAVNIAKSLQ